MADNVDRWWESAGAPGASEGAPADPPDGVGGQPGAFAPPPGEYPASSGSTSQPAIPQPPHGDPTILAPQGPGPFQQPHGLGVFPQSSVPQGSGAFPQPGTPQGSEAFPQASGQQGSGAFQQPVLYRAMPGPQPGMLPGPEGYPGAPQGYGQPGGYGIPDSQHGIPQQGLGPSMSLPFPHHGQTYGYAPQPPRKGNAGLLIGIGAVVLVLAVVIVTAVVIGTRGDDEAAIAAPTTTTQTAPPTGTSTAPVTPGWKGVLLADERIAYDVPSSWQIASESDSVVILGLSGMFAGTGKASEGENYCPGSAYRGLAGIALSTENTLPEAATTAARIAAEGGYSDSTGGKITAPTSLTTKSGLTGQFVESSGSWTPARPGCTTTTYSVYTFAFEKSAGLPMVMAILVDRGTTGELSADDAKKMIASIRLI
ncbi:hypothetical protein [Nocardia coubleae]|uniref:DUF8017 domain-containing protein n=2 Tax=Nocardia coubleae TaxID=356147 RepID=A0A846VZE0_9NOCA|nr:hypothetical protein [Nocardia coubleae]NKX86125.1 hypothetical protein [Nocardia coubleae]